MLRHSSMMSTSLNVNVIKLNCNTFKSVCYNSFIKIESLETSINKQNNQLTCFENAFSFIMPLRVMMTDGISIPSQMDKTQSCVLLTSQCLS